MTDLGTISATSSPRMPEDLAAGAAALLLVGAVALVARSLTRVSSVREKMIASFAGGVSLAFVLLELFVELSEGTGRELHVRAGPHAVHTIASLMLIGACVAFGANVYGERHPENRRTYFIALAPQAAYRALVGAALDEELHLGARGFVVFWVAMALHLGIAEHRTQAMYPREHHGWSRLIAASAPVAGAAIWSLAEPTVATFQVLLAIVAGATILGIFREEIPSAKETHAAAFFAGVVVFGGIVQARWWM